MGTYQEPSPSTYSSAASYFSRSASAQSTASLTYSYATAPTPTTLRTQQPRSQGDVPNAVKNLLLSVKELQECLREWSVGEASEGKVSDVYVRIGTNLNSTIQAFAFHKIDLSEILSVPKELRTVLEQCLAEDESPEVLDGYLPAIRQILYRLLEALQARQDQWRSSVGLGPLN
ncbi:hypothetical protein BDN72DRAFT_915278 [Pluteus cervinus]|uniref:Uncharacterized protein n=1 Tax=Pluteus cervinus TaxID=181527 RepID=A0ACD3ANS0_9AGAR|nr:hypothetical protein BDN72DRAFT_915278 [Pluteus cervinus]